MSLQIRRGPTSDRLTITPAEGELIFDTTEKSLYVGDGTVLGGIATTPTSAGDVENISAALFTNGIHSNINYQYDNLNDRINSAIDLTSYTGIISADGFKGSIFANNNSLLVDGILGSIELDGTVRSDIVPASNDSYDLGRSTARFRDLYLSGNTLFLGNAVINAVGSAVSLPAGSTVGGVLIGEGGTSGGVVDGGFYNINIVGDDSSIMVDVNNVSISATGGIVGDVTGNLSGSVLSSDGSSFLVNSFSNSVSAPGGFFGDVNGDLRGSVIGLDSSLIVNTFTNEITGNFNGRLSENLDLNGKAIIDNENVFIVPNNYAQFGSVNFNINGNIVIRRSSFSNGILDGLGGFLFEQYHNNNRADRMVFHRSRGTYETPLPLQENDRIAEIAFTGNSNELPFSPLSSSIRVVAEGGPVANLIRARIEFQCTDVAGEQDSRVLVMRPDRRVQVNLLEGLTTTLQVTGNLVGNVSNATTIGFADTTVQITAYAGGVGHAFMIDTNRSDSYTEVGSSDRPFKTFAAAITAADAIDTTVTFILMGCTVTENVDFSNTSFTSITISTTCRSIISGNIIIADVSAMSQMVFRNIEIGGTFTILGDETSEQFNSVSFYNVSFSGVVSITATNATSFYEAAFFDTVDFTNISYLYINGAQFNADLTITADDTGTYPIPSRGINPGTGGSISIVFGTIANNVYFVKGGTAAYVFQPHMTRLGRTTESYTIPAGWIVSAYGADFRGTWTNNGSMGMKISATDNRVLGTAPSYSSIIGGDRVIADLAPASSAGIAGDRAGMIAVDNTYLYVCTADYSDGLSDIWTRTLLTTGTW